MIDNEDIDLDKQLCSRRNRQAVRFIKHLTPAFQRYSFGKYLRKEERVSAKIYQAQPLRHTAKADSLPSPSLQQKGLPIRLTAGPALSLEREKVVARRTHRRPHTTNHIVSPEYSCVTVIPAPSQHMQRNEGLAKLAIYDSDLLLWIAKQTF